MPWQDFFLNPLSFHKSQACFTPEQSKKFEPIAAEYRAEVGLTDDEIGEIGSIEQTIILNHETFPRF